MKQGNRRYHALFLTGLVLLAVCSTTNGETGRRPSRWTVTAGARYRPVEYELSAEPLTGWEELAKPPDTGSAELFDGTQDEDVEYENGLISRSGDGHSGRFDTSREPWLLVFYSTVYELPDIDHASSCSDSFDARPTPYLQGRWILRQSQKGSMAVSAEYAFSRESARRYKQVMQQYVQWRQRRYAFQYEFSWDHGHGRSPYMAVVYDADTYNDMYSIRSLAGANDPWAPADPSYPRREVLSEQDVTIAEFTAIMDAELEYNLHELTFALEWARRFGERFDLFVAIGPTLNILDWKFAQSTEWFPVGSTERIAALEGTDDDIDLIAGGMFELGGRLDLSDDGRYFCEFSGRYEYLKDLDISAGGGKASITCSYYSGGIGIGVRL